MKKTGFITCLLLCVLQILGQSDKPYRGTAERIIIHLDRQEYASGENLWFKIYCTHANEYSRLSQLAFVELIDPKGYSAVRKKVLLTGGTGHGHLAIPDSLPGGLYQLLGYTNHLRNFGNKHYFKDTILLFNPETELTQSDETINTTLTDDSADSSLQVSKSLHKITCEPTTMQGQLKKKIRFSGLKSSYSTREKVDFYLVTNPLDSITNVSLSIHKTVPPDIILHPWLKNILQENTVAHQVSQPVPDDPGVRPDSTILPGFLPEKKGVILKGTVLDKSGHPAKNKNVYLSFVDTITRIKIRTSDDQGIFRFFLYPDEIQKDIVLSPDDAGGDLLIRLEDKFINEYSFRSSMSRIAQSDPYFQYLKEIYINHRILRHYQLEQVEAESLNPEPQWMKHSFHGKPDATLSFDDYILLDSLKEYLYELTPGVRSIQAGKSNNLRVVNKYTRQFMPGPPALFIDGIFCPDQRSFFNSNPSECTHMEIIQKPVLLNNRIFYGVISLFTQNGDLGKINLPGNTIRVEYNILDAPTKPLQAQPAKKNLPYFRNTLAWEPELTISESGKTAIPFTTGDGKGWYTVHVKAMGKNGSVYTLRKCFKVEDNQK